MSNTRSDFDWRGSLGSVVLVLSLVAVGPIVLLPVWLIRRVASAVPSWDPDQRWDGVRGYAMCLGLLYAFLVLRGELFASGHLDLNPMHLAARLLADALDFSLPALAQHWALGLLLAPVFALLLERSRPMTVRGPFRALTPDEEQQLAAARQAAQKQREQPQSASAHSSAATYQAKLTPTKQQRPVTQATLPIEDEADLPLDPAKLDKRTFWERVPDDAPIKHLARAEMEQAAAQANTPQASPQPEPPSKPKPKKEKQDKGDGLMDELL